MGSLVEHQVRSFAGGEFAPSLYFRGDLAKYNTAVAKCENFIPQVTGAVEKRPGFEVVGNTDLMTTSVENWNLGADPYGTALDDGSRLIPFQFNTAQSYVLVFTSSGDAYITKDAEFVEDSGAPGTLYTFSHTYTESQLATLDYAQSGDLLYLTHQDTVPRVLARLADDNWTLTDVTFGTGISAPTITSTSSTTKRWRVTAVSATGEESLASSSSKRAPGEKLKWTQIADAVSYNVYLKQSGDDADASSYGWYAEIGQPSTTGDVTYVIPSTLTEPDSSKRPLFSNRNPFEISTGVYSYPAHCAFFQQRLIYGRSDSFPQTVWGSRVGSFDNFNLSQPLQDNDAFEWELASTLVNEVTAIVPMQDLIILTAGGEWRMSGDGGGAITSKSVQALRQSQWGSAPLKPVVVGSAVLFMERDRRVLRDMEYDFSVDSYAGGNLSIFASHLFEGRRVVRLAYQRRPYFCIWAVMDDGGLLALTYDKDQQVFGWSQQTIDGLALDVVVTTKDGQDDNCTVLTTRRRSSTGWNPGFTAHPTIPGYYISTLDKSDPNWSSGSINFFPITQDETPVASWAYATAGVPSGTLTPGMVSVQTSARGDGGDVEVIHRVYVRDASGTEVEIGAPAIRTAINGSLTSAVANGTFEGVTLADDEFLVVKLSARSVTGAATSVSLLYTTSLGFGYLPPEANAAYDTGVFVETLLPRGVDTPEETNIIDLYASGDPSTIVSTGALAPLRGLVVRAVADGSVVGDVTVVWDQVGFFDPPLDRIVAANELEQSIIDNADVITLGIPYTATLESLDLEPSPQAQQSIAVRYKDVKQMFLNLYKTREGEYGPVTDNEEDMYEIKFRTDENYGDPTLLNTGLFLTAPVAGPPRTARYRIRSKEPMPFNLIGIRMVMEVAGT